MTPNYYPLLMYSESETSGCQLLRTKESQTSKFLKLSSEPPHGAPPGRAALSMGHVGAGMDDLGVLIQAWPLSYKLTFNSICLSVLMYDYDVFWQLRIMLGQNKFITIWYADIYKYICV